MVIITLCYITYPGNFNSKSSALSIVGAMRFSGILLKCLTIGCNVVGELCPEGCASSGGGEVELNRWAKTKLDHNGSRSSEDTIRLFTNHRNWFTGNKIVKKRIVTLHN